MNSSERLPASSWEARRHYFPTIEGLRGAAALGVMCGHVLLFGYLPATTRGLTGVWLGTFGVAVFFAISGFLLYRPFVAARHSRQQVGPGVPRYLLRRGTRILPAYWVALTVLAIWPGLEGVFTGEWWRYYGLLQVYSAAHQNFGIAVAWSLCVEVSFYLLLPVIAAVLARRGLGSGHRFALRWELGLVLGLGALSLLLRVFFVSTTNLAFLSATILGTFSWFSLGMLFAAIEVDRPPVIANAARALARPEICWPLALVLFAMLPLEAVSSLTALGGAFNVLICGLAAACLAAPLMLGKDHRLVHAIFANRVSVYLGTVSYGIFLWHLPLLFWFWGLGIVNGWSNPIAGLAAAGFVMAVTMGSISWFFVEQPLMQRVRSIKGFTHVREAEVEIPPEVEGKASAPLAEAPPPLIPIELISNGDAESAQRSS